MPPRTARLTTAGLVGLGAVLLGAGPAAAHVSPDKDEVPAGDFTSVTLTVGHGCEASPTTAIAVEVPDAVLNITPAVHPGWRIEVETEVLAEPVEGSHGEQITERDAVVTFIAEPGNELPDGFRDSFTLGFQAPEAPGETLYFKTVQTCAEGETAWIDEDPEAETPAPSVLVAEAEAEEAAPVETEPVAATSDDDDSSTGLAVAALVVGALGLLTGGAALASARKAPRA